MLLTFLHISDLHVRPEWMSENHLLLETCCLDINEWRQPHENADFDAVFLTGDIASRGEAEEYDEARRITDRICNAASCLPGRLFVVPGNHDVDHAQISTVKQEFHVRALQQESVLDKCFEFVPDLTWLLTKFKDYREFLHPRDNTKPRYLAPGSGSERTWYRQAVDFGGQRFRVIGLCSSLLSNLDKDKYGRMRLGKGQLRDVHDPADGSPTFLLTHHPLTWLSSDDQDRYREFMAEQQVIHLHGHAHKDEIRKDEEVFHHPNIAGIGEYYTFGAGPLDLQASERWDMPPVYYIFQLDTQTGMLSVWPRAYINGHWTSWNWFPNLQEDASFYVELPERWVVGQVRLRPSDDRPAPIRSFVEASLPDVAEWQTHRRLAALRNFSFLWLLLDQLPGGGWGRSLVPWMTEIWQGTHLTPDSIMEAEGGIESSVLAFHIYYHSHLCHMERWDPRKVFRRFKHYLLQHQDPATGGFGARAMRQEGVSLSVRLRHTALGVYGLLLLNQIERTTLIKEITTGLLFLFGRELAEYRADRNPCMLYMLMEFLRHHILELECSDFDAYDSPLQVKERIKRWKKECEAQMRERFLETTYVPVPEKYGEEEVNCHPLLVPYGCFYRMETYTFLSSCGFVTQTSDQDVQQRLSDGMNKLIRDYVRPKNVADPLKPTPSGVLPWLVPSELPIEKWPSPDLGCTAMLLANLCNEQVRKSLWDGHPPEKIECAIPLILEDIGDLFDRYLKSRTLCQEHRVCTYKSRNCISFGFIPWALM